MKYKNRQKKLRSRQRDFDTLDSKGTGHGTRGQRMTGGGFHRPGSNKK